MDKSRKKELIDQYKQERPPMGIFIIHSKATNKCHIQVSKDLRSFKNGALVRLGNNMHPVRELQKEWNELGEANFTIEILENLEYDKDESKTDYTEDLELLKSMWEEKLMKENIEIYKKRI